MKLLGILFFMLMSSVSIAKTQAVQCIQSPSERGSEEPLQARLYVPESEGKINLGQLRVTGVNDKDSASSEAKSEVNFNQQIGYSTSGQGKVASLSISSTEETHFVGQLEIISVEGKLLQSAAMNCTATYY